MSSSILNLEIDSMTDYYLDTIYEDYVTNLPINITGYTATLTVRASYNDPTILLSLSNSNGRILLGGADGTILAHFLPIDTNPSLQTVPWTTAVYDLLLVDLNGIVIKLVSGMINVVGTVTY
jgi:hypothetical protein